MTPGWIPNRPNKCQRNVRKSPVVFCKTTCDYPRGSPKSPRRLPTITQTRQNNFDASYEQPPTRCEVTDLERLKDEFNSMQRARHLPTADDQGWTNSLAPASLSFAEGRDDGRNERDCVQRATASTSFFRCYSQHTRLERA